MQCNPEQFQHKSKNATQKQYRAKNQHKPNHKCQNQTIAIPEMLFKTNTEQNHSSQNPLMLAKPDSSQTPLMPTKAELLY